VGVPPFVQRFAPSSQVLVVDDVVTTGLTVLAASSALGTDRVAGVVSANASNQVSSQLLGVPISPEEAFPYSVDR